MAGYRIPSDYKNDVPRATHNWCAPVSGTIHCGLAYPVHHRHLNAKDRVRGRVSVLVQSQPMLGPLLNGFKLTTFGVFLPDSVIYTWMRNGRAIDPSAYSKIQKFYFAPTDYSFHGSGGFAGFGGLTFGIPEITGVATGSPKYFERWADDYALSSDNLHEHVGRGGLWDWLGVPAGTVAPRVVDASKTLIPSSSVRWDIAPFMTYLLACYYYVMNVQEGDMFFTTSLNYLADALGTLQVSDVPFNNLCRPVSDPVGFLQVLQSRSSKQSYDGNIHSIFLEGATSSAYSFNSIAAMLCSGIGAHGGLIPVPYSPDLFGNIIQAGDSPVVEIPVVQSDSGDGDVVAVPQLRLQTKIQNMLDRLFVSGGRFGDILRTLWGSDSDVNVDKPDFIGVWQTSINPSNVVAQSSGSASGEDTNLGQMAARVDRYSDFKGTQGIDYYAKQPGTLMFISMLVPDPSYTQGLHPDLVAGSFGDDFNPELNGLGFTAVPRHRFVTLPANFDAGGYWVSKANIAGSVGDPNVHTVGEEPAWSWLRTDYPRLHGEFAQNGVFQYWTLVRRYSEYFSEVDETGKLQAVKVGTYYGTYVNPLSWQYLFAGTSFADPNFTLLADFDLTVTSSVSSNYMPFLGK